MYNELREQVLLANKELPKLGLVIFTWGNVSTMVREENHMLIKGSGVEYDDMTAEDIAVTDMEGKNIFSKVNPSSDTPTHIELYKAFDKAGGIVHTHSKFATIWAQMGRGIPCLGTTHADYFCGEIPCTRQLTDEEIMGDYEKNTGKVIIETFKERGIDPASVPAVLVKNHGPFAWGATMMEAVHNAAVLEYVAEMAINCLLGEGGTLATVQPALLKKHYERKFGANAYYGQGK